MQKIAPYPLFFAPKPPKALWKNEKLDIKVSPPFEGGVAGSADYMIFTKAYFPAGVVNSLLSYVINSEVCKQISIP